MVTVPGTLVEAVKVAVVVTGSPLVTSLQALAIGAGMLEGDLLSLMSLFLRKH